MSWHARLDLQYTRASSGRTDARFVHAGPLRVLRSLYPEGEAICHTVVVHPPGGIVGGDRIEIAAELDAGAHALLTTPGAARFYRSSGDAAVQDVRLRVQDGARLEWLPMETLCYSGCHAANRLHAELAPGAEMMGWDVTALGLPQAGRPFTAGSVEQSIGIDGAWLDRGLIEAGDARLLDGPLGLAGHRCLATLFLAGGHALGRERTEQALALAREQIDAGALAGSAGATCVDPRVVAVRVLAPLVEPAMQLLRRIRAAWRPALWALPPVAPRTWAL